MSDIGERLRRLRFEKRATLREVESATGVSNAYLSQLESGKVANPSLKITMVLADYYGVSIESLGRDEVEHGKCRRSSMSNPSEVKCMRCGSTRHRTESIPNGMAGECLDCGATWAISRNTWGDDWKPGGVSSAQALDDALRRAVRPASRRSAYDYFTYSCIVDQGEAGG